MNVGELVDIELKEYLDNRPSEFEALAGFLNKFHAHFESNGRSFYRDMAYPHDWTSPREEFRGKTAEEFYGILDKATAECGITKKRLETVLENYRDPSLPPDEKRAAGVAMYRALLPVYRKMREQGFAHNALTC
jgi:hypothetical protein